MSWQDTYTYEGFQVITVPSLPLRGLDALMTSALAAIASSGNRYDIIHFHALGPSLFSWVPRLLSFKTKVVVTCHGLDWQRAKWGKLSSHLIRTGEWMALHCGHEVITVAEELQPYFQKTYHRQVPYIGNGPAKYADSDSSGSFVQSLGLNPQQYILFLGHLVPEKCPDLLIQAFQTLRPFGWKLVIVGGSSDTSGYRAKLMALAHTDPDIIFTGELRGKRLAEVMRNAGLFTLPSLVEGLPLALLEAMNEYIPVLASNIPVHRRLVGRDRGMLFRVNEHANYVECLKWSLDHPQEMKEMAKRARQYIQTHHSWDKITDELLNIYTQLRPIEQCSTSNAKAYR